MGGKGLESVFLASSQLLPLLLVVWRARLEKHLFGKFLSSGKGLGACHYCCFQKLLRGSADPQAEWKGGAVWRPALAFPGPRWNQASVLS